MQRITIIIDNVTCHLHDCHKLVDMFVKIVLLSSLLTSSNTVSFAIALCVNVVFSYSKYQFLFPTSILN